MIKKHSMFKKHSKKLAAGLTRAEAMARFPYSPRMGDKRAFSYNRKSGVAVWV